MMIIEEKNLGCGTNQDYMGNKSYYVEQITTAKEGTTILLLWNIYRLQREQKFRPQKKSTL
jgi:hypothetical protein